MGGPLRAIRAEVPCVADYFFSVLVCHSSSGPTLVNLFINTSDLRVNRGLGKNQQKVTPAISQRSLPLDSKLSCLIS